VKSSSELSRSSLNATFNLQLLCFNFQVHHGALAKDTCAIVRRFSLEISVNCALFGKSTNFGTEVDQHIMNKFGGGAIG